MTSYGVNLRSGIAETGINGTTAHSKDTKRSLLHCFQPEEDGILMSGNRAITETSRPRAGANAMVQPSTCVTRLCAAGALRCVSNLKWNAKNLCKRHTQHLNSNWIPRNLFRNWLSVKWGAIRNIHKSQYRISTQKCRCCQIVRDS